MRISATGDVLVGKTAIAVATDGIELNVADYLAVTRDGGVTGYFNRRTSDGNILEFRKDNTTVGSIGTKQGTVHLTGKYSGLSMNYYDATNGIILPVDTNGAGRNGVDDIGYSGNRFRDLYLSGGVYLGGTGASNKLNDYETGTYTPALNLVTYTATTSQGSYTKIGNMVTAKIYMVFSSLDNSDTSGFNISLPFAANTSNQYTAGTSTIDATLSSIFTVAGHDLIRGSYVTGGSLILSRANGVFLYSSGCASSGTLAITVHYTVA